MKIERVDDKTVKCFLSNEELEEYEIDYKDFVTRSEKAREVVQEIIEQATEEVGYRPPKFAFDLQIMMMPEQGLVLTLSEKDPVDLNNKDQMLSYLKELKNIFQTAKNEVDKAGVALQSQGDAVGNTAGGKAEEQAENKIEKSVNLPKPEHAIFRFDDMASVLGYAAIMPTNLRVQSALYAMDGKYYLSLHKGNASYERYSRACIQAMEFAGIYTALEDKILFLQEHGECLIEEGALKKLRF